MLTPNSSLMRHPDRGAGFYHKKRERFGRASLVETGRWDPCRLMGTYSLDRMHSA